MTRRASHPLVKPAAPSLEQTRDLGSYNDQVIAWQRGLSETMLRELASDYLRGVISSDTIDAYEEYQRRYPATKEQHPRASKGKGKSVSARTPKVNRSSRYA